MTNTANKHSLMKYLILFTLFFNSASIWTQSREVTQTKPEMKKKISAAFRAFGLSADNCSIGTQKPYRDEPDKKMRRWAGGSQCVHLSQDIQSNPHLTEFAAFCVAASTKNHDIDKGFYAFCAAICASMIAASIPICLAIDALPLSDQCISHTSAYIFLCKLLASFVPIYLAATNGPYYSKIDNAISHHLNARTFTQACQKLIEQNNLKPLATYYAFAKLIKHRPLSQQTQNCIIKWTLKNNDFTITSARTNYTSMSAHIWKRVNA
ncbi:hypothetical protein BH09DEP1_BH09DEP1_3720 [soil metagenome]